jgi:aspartate/methionine/tyrosine aminotransferase
MTMLPDFRLETYLGKWEFACRYHMTASDMQTLSLKELLALASPEDRAVWEDLPLHYIEPTGSPALRQAISGSYKKVAPEDILAFAGAEEGIFCAMHAILEKDDHAIVVTPNYQSAEELPRSICAVSGVALDPDNNWSLDLAKMRAAIRPNTKLISINFPHNPTGKILDRATFDGLVALCRQHGIWLFSDEVYRGLERSPALQLPAAVDAYEKGLSLGVMSKAYGLPGLRVGWIAARDRDLLYRMERIKHYLSICNANPSEHLAVIALKAGEQIMARNRALIADNLKATTAFFASFPDLFEWRDGDGGCIAFPRYKGKDGVEAFCRRLVEDAGIVLLPASLYASSLTETPKDRFRIGFGRTHVPEGLSAMRSYLMKNAA